VAIKARKVTSEMRYVVEIRLLIRKLKQIVQWLSTSRTNSAIDQWVKGIKDISEFGRTSFQNNVIIDDPIKNIMKVWMYHATHCRQEPTPIRFSVTLSWSSFSSTMDCNIEYDNH